MQFTPKTNITTSDGVVIGPNKRQKVAYVFQADLPAGGRKQVIVSNTQNWNKIKTEFESKYAN